MMKCPANAVNSEWLRRPAVTKWLRANFDRYTTNTAIAKELNVSISALRFCLLQELGLQRMQMEYWTPEQVVELEASYLIMGDKEIAANFQLKYPKSKPWTLKHIEKKRNYLGLHRPTSALHAIAKRRYGREPSLPPEQYGRRDAKEGDIHTWRNQRGVWAAHIKSGGIWHHAGRFLWEKANGPVPKGFRIMYKDGDATNYALDNLVMVPTGDVPKLAKNGARDLTDKYVAAMILGSRHKLTRQEHKQQQEQLLKHPELLQLKRLHITLGRTIKEHKS